MRKTSKQKAKTPEPRTRPRVLTLLFLIALAAYANSFALGLAHDSRAVITQDARIREATVENLRLIVTRDYWWPNSVDRLYRPVTTASLLVNYAVFGNGDRAAGYHLLNFLLHMVNTWLVFELAWIVLGSARAALFAAALWGVHPAGTECVTQIVGRADALAAASVLGGLLLYIRSQGARTAVGLFAIATLGLFAKEMAVVLIGLMLLWDLAFRQGTAGIRDRFPAYAAVAASLAAFFVVRAVVFQDVPWPQQPYMDNILRGADFFTARLTAVKVLGLQLLLLVFPFQLSIDRSFREIQLSTAGDPWAWLSLLVVGGLIAFAFARRRRYPIVFWLVGFCGITLLPTSNLVVLIGTIMGERFLYLPAVAFAIGVVALVYARLSSARARTAVLGTLIALYGARTLARNFDWRDDLTLAAADVRTSPASARLHDMLAKALYEQDERRHIDRIIREQETAWEIVKPLPPERSSELIPAHLGIYYFTKAGMAGREWYEKAVAALIEARKISQAAEKAFDAAQIAHGKPLARRRSFQLLYFYLAYAQQNLGRNREALEALRYGRGIEPRFLEAYQGMAELYVAAGRPDGAALALLERILIEGETPAVLTALRDVYTRIPDGGCAVEMPLRLNLACPRVRQDICLAANDLAGAFDEARMAPEALQMRRDAIRRYGCPDSGTPSRLPEL